MACEPGCGRKREHNMALESIVTKTRGSGLRPVLPLPHCAQAGERYENCRGIGARSKGVQITGSTGGLGFAIAGRLAAEGCSIVLNGLARADGPARPTSTQQ
jgi:hypothetical protein